MANAWMDGGNDQKPEQTKGRKWVGWVIAAIVVAALAVYAHFANQ